MKQQGLALLVFWASLAAFAADKPPLTDSDAEGLIASGHCGSVTGLRGTGLSPVGSGWIVSPSPAEICVAGDGGIKTIGRPISRCIRIEKFGGPPVFVNVFSSEPPNLVWKVDGYERAPMPKGFQFPPMRGVQ